MDYDLPKSGKWQVIVTTHSPVFIDLGRDNTSIVRVERLPDGDAFGTTIYRPAKAKLDTDDVECLKLLNLCDPYVSEFFFGGRTIVVEGDTEYTAFQYLIQCEPEQFKDIHIVRARGKATIRSLCKILNQFGKPYAVLHDSDSPTAKRKNGDAIKNPAWTMNLRIQEEIADRLAANAVILVASIPNFEQAYMGESVQTEKPVTTWKKIQSDEEFRTKMRKLLKALCGESDELPSGAFAWKAENELLSAFEADEAKVS